MAGNPGKAASGKRKRRTRSYEADASITVFLALSLAVILSLLFTLLDGARRNASRMQIECALETSMESALSEFCRPLLERYGLLFVDSAYGTGAQGNEALKEHVKSVLDRNLERGGALPVSGRTFTALHADELEITGTRYAADNNCEAVLEQITAYMGAVPGGTALTDFLQEVDQFHGIELQNSDWQKRRAKNDAAVGDALGRSLEAREPRKQEIREHPESAGTLTEEEGKAGESEGKLSTLRNKWNQFVLSWWTDAEISDDSVDGSLLYTGRTPYQGTDLTVQNAHGYGRADNLLLDLYLLEKCSAFQNAVGSDDPHALQYEIEYLLVGKEQDSENLKSVGERILLSRQVVNCAYLFTDSGKTAEAEALAGVIAAVLLVPDAAEAFKTAILFGWAGAESQVDVRVLMNGGKVPLFKDGSTWQTSLLDAFLPVTKGKSADTGLCYRDYLMIFLYLTGEQSKTERFMDLCEANIRLEPGYDSFRIDRCLDSFRVSAAVGSAYGFSYRTEREITYN